MVEDTCRRLRTGQIEPSGPGEAACDSTARGTAMTIPAMLTTLADAWLHNLDPYAIQLDWFPGGGIRWYGLSYITGFVLGYLLIRRIIAAGRTPMTKEAAADFVVTVAVSIVIGGRLGYVLFYRPELLGLLTNAQGEVYAPYWGVLAINEGGMASHGGILGGIGGCFFFAWRQRIRVAHLFDIAAFGTPIGLLMGRLANFVNGELYGRVCSADSPVAVKFPQEMYDWPGAEEGGIEQQHLADLMGWAPGLGIRGGDDSHRVLGNTLRAIQDGNADVIAFVSPMIQARYPSQLFAGLTEGVIVFVVLLILFRKPVKAGLIGGAFCVTYALMRVINEFFRLPDAHLMTDGQIPAVTRGQWLSIGLFVLGAAVIVTALRGKGDKLGGWYSAKA